MEEIGAWIYLGVAALAFLYTFLLIWQARPYL